MFGVIGEPRTLDPGSPLASDLTHVVAQPEGPWRVVRRVPGLEIVYEPDPTWTGPRPLLGRLIVRYVQSLSTAIDLVQRGRLDAAALPATVNLVDRLDARGVDSAVAFGREVVYLDLRGVDAEATRSAIATTVPRTALQEAFVRDLGRPSRTLHPAPGPNGADGPLAFGASRQSSTGTLQIAAPVGDELLGLFQRALHDTWEESGFMVDVVTIDARTFYGAWTRDPPVEVLLGRSSGPGLPGDRRASTTTQAVPLFHMATVVAWRDGVNGIQRAGIERGPLWGTHRWWVDHDDG